MRLLLRLESERKSCAIWYILFCQSPKEPLRRAALPASIDTFPRSGQFGCGSPRWVFRGHSFFFVFLRYLFLFDRETSTPWEMREEVEDIETGSVTVAVVRV
ncbi:MAG: hypothetical protein BECKG1743F_GA0114225_107521 [Candidatus Kentron sp. G]|nr:MAG: hypothetical protein BECKG1743F_GA0114225_107521 [Candidatus Kentron sp. G]